MRGPRHPRLMAAELSSDTAPYHAAGQHHVRVHLPGRGAALGHTAALVITRRATPGFPTSDSAVPMFRPRVQRIHPETTVMCLTFDLDYAISHGLSVGLSSYLWPSIDNTIQL